MGVYSFLCLAMAALVVTCATAELSASSTVMPKEEAFVLKVIKDAPKEAVFFIFDIKGSQLTKDVVNKAFEGLPVLNKFMVLGGQRYIVVLESKAGDRAVLRDLVIPQATDVDVFPAESLDEFFEYSDVPGWQSKDCLRLEDENLYMVEITIREEGMNLTMFKNHITQYFKAVLAANKLDECQFHPTGFFPLTFISFVRLSPYRIDRALLEMSWFIGGPYQFDVRTRPIVNI